MFRHCDGCGRRCDSDKGLIPESGSSGQVILSQEYPLLAGESRDYEGLHQKSPLPSARIVCKLLLCSWAKVAELVDALDLGSSSARSGGSNPPFRTFRGNCQIDETLVLGRWSNKGDPDRYRVSVIGQESRMGRNGFGVDHSES